MPPRRYHSPLTGDLWPDVRPAIGTVVGLANFLNNRRPRRKPPEGVDAAIALATEAAGAFAGIPKIVRAGEIEGRIISDAYWQAKEAKRLLTPHVDDGEFLQHQNWWSRFREMVPGDPERGRAGRVPEPTVTTRAARLAWWAANLTEKAAAGNVDAEMSDLSYAHDVVQGALVELDEARVARTAVAEVERVWRFVVAAGRLPVPVVDDALLAAFEAAIMVDAHEFATHLAKHGWGQGTDDGSST
jgi:hypothetical protein